MVNIVFTRNDLMSKGWFWKCKLKTNSKLKCFHRRLSCLRGAKKLEQCELLYKKLQSQGDHFIKKIYM